MLGLDQVFVLTAHITGCKGGAMTVHPNRRIAVDYVAPTSELGSQRSSVIAPNQSWDLYDCYLDRCEAKDLLDQLTWQFDKAEGRV